MIVGLYDFSINREATIPNTPVLKFWPYIILEYFVLLIFLITFSYTFFSIDLLFKFKYSTSFDNELALFASSSVRRSIDYFSIFHSSSALTLGPMLNDIFDSSTLLIDFKNFSVLAWDYCLFHLIHEIP